MQVQGETGSMAGVQRQRTSGCMADDFWDRKCRQLTHFVGGFPCDGEFVLTLRILTGWTGGRDTDVPTKMTSLSGQLGFSLAAAQRLSSVRSSPRGRNT